MKTLFASIAALALMTSAALAVDCKNFPIVTPDVAPVNRTKVEASGVSNLGGTAYTKAAFCPVAAAPGTCTGESLSERVGSILTAYVTYDGDVPDIERHRNGIQVGPIFIPLTGFIPGAC